MCNDVEMMKDLILILKICGVLLIGLGVSLFVVYLVE